MKTGWLWLKWSFSKGLLCCRLFVYTVQCNTIFDLVWDALFQSQNHFEYVKSVYVWCVAGLWFRRFSTLITFCCFRYVCCWSFESCCRYLSSRSNETPTTRIRSLFLELNVCTVHFQPLKSIRSKVRKHLLFEFNDLPINGVMMPISIFMISILSHMHSAP